MRSEVNGEKRRRREPTICTEEHPAGRTWTKRFKTKEAQQDVWVLLPNISII